MVLTTIQLTNLARIKLLESTSEIISDETLLIYANLTYQDLIKRIFTNNKILSATVNFSNGVGAFPATFGTLYGSAQNSSGQTYEEVTIEDFDNNTLPYMITVEGGQFKCLPLTTSSLDIKYYPVFPTLTAGVNPSIDEYFHECIVYGILSRAFEDLQDEQLSSLYTSKYESMVNSKTAIQSNYEEGNQKGGQMFTWQSLIN